jgi:putative ABC transport system substrate-binding protein
MIGRREVITLLGGAATAWTLAARAQQTGRMRRIGVLLPDIADEAETQILATRFLQGLQELGWTDGRNVQIEWRWSTVDGERYRTLAAELVGLGPDLLLAAGATVAPMQAATRTIPIVFVGLNDPVGGGYVASLAHPGGNITGFARPEYGFSAKWLQLLNQIAPTVSRAAVIRAPLGPGNPGQLGALQGAAFILGMELTPIDPTNVGEMERAIMDFAGRPNGGVIVPTNAAASNRRDVIIALAAQHRLPAVYGERGFVAAGGLVSYGTDLADQFRRAAGYVDRILKGEKPADLPVQLPTKFTLAINLKTAKSLGLTVPPSLLAIADEVIE